MTQYTSPVDQATQYGTLVSIVQGNEYSAIPLEFSLKRFLGWDDATIKEFVKARKKVLSKKEKSRPKNLLSPGSACCGAQTPCCQE